MFVALGALGAAAVVLLIVLVAGGGGDDDDETGGGPTTTENDSPDTTEQDIEIPDITLPDDEGGGGGQVAAGAVTVADSGFAEYQDELYEETYTAYGVIVENTSDQVARNVSVQIGFMDASGTVLTSETEYITVLMPGQKFGVGRTAIEATGVTELSVQVSEPSEWDDPGSFGELTVEGLSVTFGDYNAPQAAFTVKSTYAEQLDGPNVFAIYRDSSGKIVGGDYDFMDFIQAGGSTVGEVSSYASLPNVDASKTEVFVDPNIY